MKPSTIRAAAVLSGAILIAVGIGMIHVPFGIIAGGIMLFGLGLIGHLRAARPTGDKQ